MYYKLFIFGSKDLFALVRIPQLEFSLKEGSVFNFKGKSYKILNFKLVAMEIEFNDKGLEKFPVVDTQRDYLLNADLPELYITELPQF